MADYPRAVVREVAGKIVIDDPDARAVIRAVDRENCRRLVRERMRDRVEHFVRRIAELGRSGAELLVVVLNVDDLNGGALAEVLMPGHNWQAYRERGELPYARGLAERPALQAAIAEFDPTAGAELAAIAGVAVLVMDFETIAAFDAEEICGG